MSHDSSIFTYGTIWHYLFVICCVYTLCDLELETAIQRNHSAPTFSKISYPHFICRLQLSFVLTFAFNTKPVAIYANLMHWAMFGTNWGGLNVGLICILVYLCTDFMICHAKIPEMHLLINYIFMSAFYLQKLLWHAGESSCPLVFH
jgi:hypothetical protein